MLPQLLGTEKVGEDPKLVTLLSTQPLKWVLKSGASL